MLRLINHIDFYSESLIFLDGKIKKERSYLSLYMRRIPTTANSAVPAITPNTIPTISPALSPPAIMFEVQLLGKQIFI